MREFTVGRDDEFATLERRLHKGGSGNGLLLRANYGSGKTHLLRLIEDLALADGYAVSFVEVSAQNGIRFNRLDQVAGAVVRSLRLPTGEPGLRTLFERYDAAGYRMYDQDMLDERAELSSDGRWDYSDHLASEALYIALRAWERSEDDDVRDLAVNWLSFPDRYANQRRRLKTELVDELYVGDPRSDAELFATMGWSADDYEPAWQLLDGLDQLVKLSGHRGLVLLFDEIEDVIYGLNNRRLEAQALHYLCDFFVGRYVGDSYFAVTPDFVEKTQTALLMKGLYDFPFTRLTELAHFALSPLTFDDFLILAARVVSVHATAYSWDAERLVDFPKIAQMLLREWNPDEPQRVRLAAKHLVALLDEELEESGA